MGILKRFRRYKKDDEPAKYRLAGMVHYSIPDDTYVCLVSVIGKSGAVIDVQNMMFEILPEGIPEDVVIDEDLPLTEIKFGSGFSVLLAEPIEFGAGLFPEQREWKNLSDFIVKRK